MIFFDVFIPVWLLQLEMSWDFFRLFKGVLHCRYEFFAVSLCCRFFQSGDLTAVRLYEYLFSWLEDCHRVVSSHFFLSLSFFLPSCKLRDSPLAKRATQPAAPLHHGLPKAREQESEKARKRQPTREARVKQGRPIPPRPITTRR